MQKINLIPEVKQQQLKTKKNNVLATTFTVVTAIILGAIIIVLLSYIVARKAQIASTDTQKATLNQQLQVYSGLEKTVLSLETGLSDIKTIVGSDSKWLSVYEEIEKSTPTDVRFKSMKIAADNSVTAELDGKDVNSIDRFIKSFSGAQTDKKANAFTGLAVDSYTAHDASVSFSAKFIINKDAF
jgi:hypothetical protein